MNPLARILTVVAALGALVTSALADVTWYDTWAQASVAAQKTNHPVLVFFTGEDWCVPCKLLEKEILENATFQTWAKQNVVLMRLDFPRHHKQPPAVAARNAAFAQHYQVTGFPAVIYVAPRGQYLGMQPGYSRLGPTNWTKSAEWVIKVGKQRAGLQ